MPLRDCMRGSAIMEPSPRWKKIILGSVVLPVVVGLIACRRAVDVPNLPVQATAQPEETAESETGPAAGRSTPEPDEQPRPAEETAGKIEPELPPPLVEDPESLERL